MTWHRVEETSNIAPGEKVLIRVGEREILLCRVQSGYYAFASRCSHAAWPLAGEPIEGHEIICTLHGARFDMRDGCPTLGPASKPLATYPVEHREGALYVSLSE